MMDKKIIAGAKEAVFWTTWRLQLTIPSVLAQDEEFCLRLTAFAPDGLPSDGFDREIVFTDSQGIEGLPKSVRLSSSDGGHLTIDGLRAEGPSHAVVVAKPEGCPSTVSSSPAWVFEEPEYRIYWGDLHVHTAYSNCSPWACKDPEFCYAYARDATYLDFAAPADHLHGIAAEEIRWPRLQELVRRYDSPGSFVPFLAFESSHRSGFGGDNNAYFLGADAPYFWIEHDDMSSTAPEIHLRELWEFLDTAGQEYFTIPHHTGRAGKYRSFADDTYDPAREPLLEIYSLWGSSECRWNHFPLYAGNADGPCYFQDVLRARVSIRSHCVQRRPHDVARRREQGVSARRAEMARQLHAQGASRGACLAANAGFSVEGDAPKALLRHHLRADPAGRSDRRPEYGAGRGDWAK